MPLYPLMDPQTAGLLSAGFAGMEASGPSRMPTSLGQIFGRAGGAGMQAYMGAGKLANEQAMKEKELGILSSFRDAQMRQMALQEEEARRKQALQGQLAGLLSPVQPAQAALSQGAAVGEVGPTVRNAERMDAMSGPQLPQITAQQLMPFAAGGVNTDPILKLLEAGKPAAPKLHNAAPGTVVLEQTPTGVRPVYTAPNKAETPDDFSRALAAAGIAPGTPEYIRLNQERLKKLTSHAPAPSITNIDRRTGEGIAKEIGPMLSDSRNSALGAADAVDTAARVRQAIAGGNVNLGPTASIRTKADQFAQILGVGGETTEERLQNTRGVIRGLAQFTIAARKSLKGQGQVSDFEGKLLQKAESGEIDDMTLPELRSFIGVTERLARKQHDAHKRNVDVMRQRPDLANLVPFYEVPDLPAAEAPQAPAQAQRRKDTVYMTPRGPLKWNGMGWVQP